MLNLLINLLMLSLVTYMYNKVQIITEIKAKPGTAYDPMKCIHKQLKKCLLLQLTKLQSLLIGRTQAHGNGRNYRFQ